MSEVTTNNNVKINKNAALEAIRKAKESVPVADATPIAEANETTVVKTPKAKPEHSPKAKSTRGIDPNMKTTWIPFDVKPEFGEMIRRVARVRDCSVNDIYVKIIKNALTDEMVKGLEAEAAQAPEPKTQSLDSKTPDQLQAAADKAQKQLEAIKAKLAAIKGAAKPE